jgi:hypothetical protein
MKDLCDKMYIYERKINDNNFSKIFGKVKNDLFKIYHKLKIKYIGKTNRKTYFCECYNKK